MLSVEDKLGVQHQQEQLVTWHDEVLGGAGGQVRGAARPAGAGGRHRDGHARAAARHQVRLCAAPHARHAAPRDAARRAGGAAARLLAAPRQAAGRAARIRPGAGLLHGPAGARARADCAGEEHLTLNTSASVLLYYLPPHRTRATRRGPATTQTARCRCGAARTWRP